jgi:hypothetical protein
MAPLEMAGKGAVLPVEEKSCINWPMGGNSAENAGIAGRWVVGAAVLPTKVGEELRDFSGA